MYAISVVNKGNVAINHKGLCTGNKNNNVLIKEIIAGLIQPEWVQQPWGSSPMGPERDSRVFMLGSSTRPATRSSPGRLAGTRSEDKWARPKRTSRNLRNRPPWSGLEKNRQAYAQFGNTEG